MSSFVKSHLSDEEELKLTFAYFNPFQVPFATRPNHLIIPLAFLGFGIGMVDSCMMPGSVIIVIFFMM
jgi:hypothetical protein